MQDLFVLRQVDVSPDMDMVVMRFAGHRCMVPYKTAFEIINSVRMAGKMASRYEGNHVKEWRDFAESDREPAKFPTHRGYRRSNLQSNVKSWEVAFDGAIVKIKLDDLTVGFHYSDALRWYTMSRIASREAKAWAGDTSREMRGIGYLNDAEENYKYGFNKEASA